MENVFTHKYKVTDLPSVKCGHKEYGPIKILKGFYIASFFHLTIQTAVLIQTLTELGAEVQWSNCNIMFSTQDHVIAPIAKAGIPVFAWKDETKDEYSWCIEKLSVFYGDYFLNMVLG